MMGRERTYHVVCLSIDAGTPCVYVLTGAYPSRDAAVRDAHSQIEAARGGFPMAARVVSPKAEVRLNDGLYHFAHDVIECTYAATSGHQSHGLAWGEYYREFAEELARDAGQYAVGRSTDVVELRPSERDAADGISADVMDAWRKRGKSKKTAAALLKAFTAECTDRDSYESAVQACERAMQSMCVLG